MDDILPIAVLLWRNEPCTGCEIIVALSNFSEVIVSPIKRRKNILLSGLECKSFSWKIIKIINHYSNEIFFICHKGLCLGSVI